MFYVYICNFVVRKITYLQYDRESEVIVQRCYLHSNVMEVLMSLLPVINFVCGLHIVWLYTQIYSLLLMLYKFDR